MNKGKRAVLYLRVSTGEQTVTNQRRELEDTAAQRGWEIVEEYADEGVSGSKGRDRRPGLDKMLKDATRGRFDVVMVWAVDRIGRSLPDLIATLQELHGAKVDLFLHQQALDTTTPAGRAMFQMLGVFGEFERAMIVARVNAGLARAKSEQAAGIVRRNAQGVKLKAIGRPKVGGEVVDAVRLRLQAGVGIVKVARELGVGVSTVQRVRSEMDEARRPVASGVGLGQDAANR